MARREILDIPRVLSIATISLMSCASLYSVAIAQVNADQKIHCVVQRRPNAAGPIDILIDFQHSTINGAPADGRLRKETSGDLNAYSIFSSNFILNVDAWADGAGASGVRAINYITIDRIHSAIRATTVTLPDGRSISGRGDCDVAAGRAPAP